MLLNPRTTRSAWASTLGALLALGLAACSDNNNNNDNKGPTADPTAANYPGLDELGRPLKPLNNPGCVITSKVLAVAVGAGETALIGKASGTGTGILFNGATCGPVVPTTANTTQISVTAGANSTIIIDYSNGVFMPGAAAVGFLVDFGSASGSLKLRGSSAADSFYVGGSGTDAFLGVNGDTKADIEAKTSGGTALSITLSGGPGNDTLSGAGFGTYTAFTGNLWLWGGAGNDTLTGGDGNDRIAGGEGADIIKGGKGDDVMWGEAGADTFIGEAGTSTGKDYYFGNAGTTTVTDAISADTSTDVMDYSLRTGAMTVVMNAEWAGAYTLATSTAASGTFSIYTDVDNSTSTEDHIGVDIENFIGGSGDDTITGNALNNRLEGRGGNDTFVETSDTSTDIFVGAGGTAADVATGDTVDYSVRTGNLVLKISGKAESGESGENDTIGTDIENLTGGSGDDTLWGSAANNTLNGGPGTDTLYGGAGDDVLIGGDGNDTLWGQDGDDTFLAINTGTTDGDDVILCGPGVDVLDYHSRTVAMTVNLAQGGTSTGLTAGGENDTISSASSTTDDCEVAVGGAGGSNTLIGNTLDNILDGYGATSTTIDGKGGVDICVNASSTSDMSNCEL